MIEAKQTTFHAGAKEAAEQIFNAIQVAKENEQDANEGLSMFWDIESALLNGSAANGFFPKIINHPDPYSYVLSKTIKKYCENNSIKFSINFCSTLKMIDGWLVNNFSTFLNAAIELNDNNTIYQQTAYCDNNPEFIWKFTKDEDERINSTKNSLKECIEKIRSGIEDDKNLTNNQRETLQSFIKNGDKIPHLRISAGGALLKKDAILYQLLYQKYVLGQKLPKNILFIDNDRNYAHTLINDDDQRRRISNVLKVLGCELTPIIINATRPSIEELKNCYQQTGKEIDIKDITVELHRLLGIQKTEEETIKEANELEVKWLNEKKSRLEELLSKEDSKLIGEIYKDNIQYIDNRLKELQPSKLLECAETRSFTMAERQHG